MTKILKHSWAHVFTAARTEAANRPNISNILKAKTLKTETTHAAALIIAMKLLSMRISSLLQSANKWLS